MAMLRPAQCSVQEADHLLGQIPVPLAPAPAPHHVARYAPQVSGQPFFPVFSAGANPTPLPPASIAHSMPAASSVDPRGTLPPSLQPSLPQMLQTTALASMATTVPASAASHGLATSGGGALGMPVIDGLGGLLPAALGSGMHGMSGADALAGLSGQGAATGAVGGAGAAGGGGVSGSSAMPPQS